MTTIKKLWIGVGVLALLSPLGLLIPALLGAGGAWGEWSLDKIKILMGYVPEGMKHRAESWKAPLPDYTVPGQGRGLLGESMGYLLTAIIGVAAVAGVMYLIVRLLGRKDGRE